MNDTSTLTDLPTACKGRCPTCCTEGVSIDKAWQLSLEQAECPSGVFHARRTGDRRVLHLSAVLVDGVCW